MAKVKVFYGMPTHGAYAPDGTYHRQVRAVMATTSQKKVAEATNTSVNDIRMYWSVTSNTSDIKVAMKYEGRLVLIENRYTTIPIVLDVVDNIRDNHKRSRD